MYLLMHSEATPPPASPRKRLAHLGGWPAHLLRGLEEGPPGTSWSVGSGRAALGTLRGWSGQAQYRPLEPMASEGLQHLSSLSMGRAPRAKGQGGWVGYQGLWPLPIPALVASDGGSSKSQDEPGLFLGLESSHLSWFV